MYDVVACNENMPACNRLAGCLQAACNALVPPARHLWSHIRGALCKTDGTTLAKSFIPQPSGRFLLYIYENGSKWKVPIPHLWKRLTLLLKMCVQGFLFCCTSPLHTARKMCHSWAHAKEKSAHPGALLQKEAAQITYWFYHPDCWLSPAGAEEMSESVDWDWRYGGTCARMLMRRTWRCVM